MPGPSQTLSTPPSVPSFLDPYLPQPSSPSPRPFVTLTYAASLDSHLSLAPGVQTALSGPESKSMTHYLRSHHSAILIGVSTAVADDPGLNCRIEGAGWAQQPRPVVLDPQVRWHFHRDSRVLQTARDGRGKAPWILVSAQGLRKCEEADEAAAREMRECLEEAGGRFVELDDDTLDETGRWDWGFVLARLKAEGVQSVMVEGGGAVINALLETGNTHLVDSVVVTVAPVYLGAGGVNVSPPSAKTEPAARLRDVEWCVLGRDVVMAARPERPET